MTIFTAQPNTQCTTWQYFDAFKTEINKNDGVYKFFKVLRNIAKIAIAILVAIGSTYYLTQLGTAQAFLATACDATLLTKVFGSVCALKKSFGVAWKEKAISQKLFYNSLELLTDACSFSSLLGYGKYLRTFFLSNTINAAIDVKKYSAKFEENGLGVKSKFDMACSRFKILNTLSLGLIKHPLMSREDPAELRKLAMMRVAKSLCSLAVALIPLITLLSGAVLLTKITLVVISTASAIFSLTSKVYADTTSHKMAVLNAKLA